MNNYKITDVKAHEVFNGIWEPIFEVTVHVGDRILGLSVTPTGQSTGMYEAKEVCDGEKRFDGKGCMKTVRSVENEIREKLIGMYVTKQTEIDLLIKNLDGTDDKCRLGANVMSAGSCAVTAAAERAIGVPVYKYLNKKANILPVPMLDFISGSHYSYGTSSETKNLVFSR